MVNEAYTCLTHPESKFLLDSGATNHINNFSAYLETIKTLPQPLSIHFGGKDHRAQAISRGHLNVVATLADIHGRITSNHASYVPESQAVAHTMKSRPRLAQQPALKAPLLKLRIQWTIPVFL